jgi:glycerophosphoryl diester phosphodiesterase
VADWLTTVPVAHRGLHDGTRPENSMAAFAAAAEAGYAIELDVHLSADGVLVVFHDDDTARLTGRSLRVVRTSAAELTALTLLGTQERIPLLTEVFDLVAGRVPVLVEVKAGRGAAAVGPELVTELRRCTGPVAVQSFDPRIVLWLRRHAPWVVRGQLGGGAGPDSPWWLRWGLGAMPLNLLSRPQFLGYHVDEMPSRAAGFWRRVLGVPLLAWTVRSPEQLRLATECAANPIFENLRPAGTPDPV